MMKFNPVSLDWKKYVLKIFFSEYYTFFNLIKEKLKIVKIQERKIVL